MSLSFTRAKQLNLKMVSKGANWVMHLDFESIRSSEIGTFMEDSLEKIPEMEKKMEDVQDKFGIDLRSLSNLTVLVTVKDIKELAFSRVGWTLCCFKSHEEREYVEETKIWKKPSFQQIRKRQWHSVFLKKEKLFLDEIVIMYRRGFFWLIGKRMGPKAIRYCSR